MGVVELAIVEPQHQTVILGNPNVRLRGEQVSGGHPPLFFKWYSSLNAATDASKTALMDLSKHAPANPLDFVTALGVGSHVLSFTAKDVEDDAPVALKTVKDAGMAGGPPAAENPCIIHVLLATMVLPMPDGGPAPLSKADSTLQAEAPLQWGKPENEASEVNVPNPDYHKINRIRYLWRFTPSGSPDNRASAELAPAVEALEFQYGKKKDDPATVQCTVQYKGALPTSLDLGNYILTLRVEDIQNPSAGNEASLPVVINV